LRYKGGLLSRKIIVSHISCGLQEEKNGCEVYDWNGQGEYKGKIGN